MLHNVPISVEFQQTSMQGKCTLNIKLSTQVSQMTMLELLEHTVKIFLFPDCFLCWVWVPIGGHGPIQLESSTACFSVLSGRLGEFLNNKFKNAKPV